MSATYFKLQFGDYLYHDGANNFTSVSEGQPARLRQATRPATDGAYTAGGLLAARKLVVRGFVAATDPTDDSAVRAAWDAFKAAHAPGPPRRLFIDDNRYINAEVDNVSDSEWEGLPQRTYEVAFFCADPYWYAAEEGEASISSADLADGANTVTTAGTATSLPAISIDVSSFTAGATVTVTDGDGNAATLTPTATGTYLVDSVAEDVTRSGSSVIAEWSGVFLVLKAGDNAWTLTTTGTIALGDVSVAWQDRWY
jgi:hypothetical protein